MDLKMWCIIASILIVSAGASRYDLGPQRFYETSSPAPRREQNAQPKDVVLYLTPNQIRALEAGGAVVRPADDNEEAAEEAQPENEEQPENAEEEQEQEQEQEQEENGAEQPEQQEEAEQPEQESDDDIRAQDFDLEEIFRILNDDELEQEEENVEQARNEPPVTEEPQEDNAEEQRQIPLRFLIRQNQQQKSQLPQQQRQEKYVAPSEQKARSKIYAAIRYQRNEQAKRSRVQFARQQDTRPVQEQQNQAEEPKRFRLVPYEVVEQPEEAAPEQQAQDEQQTQQEQEQQQDTQEQAEEQRTEQENEERLIDLLTPLVSPDKLAEFIGRRKNKLSKNEQELQAILSELKSSTKYNDQKYAIEIERLRANLQKQNTLAKAEAVAKVSPQLISNEIQKRRPSQSAKLLKAPASAARKPEGKRQKAPRLQPVPVEVKSVAKTQKEARPVPVEFEKRVPVPVTRNVYVKVNKPYLVERAVPVEIKKEIPVEVPIRKPQRVTILRHIWEN